MTQLDPRAFTENKGEVVANIQQAAVLNCMLPKGFRFELLENIQKLEPPQMKIGKRTKIVFLP
jgi:hypothetical protein